MASFYYTHPIIAIYGDFFMGALDDMQSDIFWQFVSFFDCLCLLMEYEHTDTTNALKLFKKILDSREQVYIKLDEWGDMQKIECFDDEYCVIGDNEYITKDFIITALKSGDSELLAGYGFGKKCFLETATKIGVEVPCEVLYKAQSPDIFHDWDNPLTPVVKELQEENKELKKSIQVVKPIHNFKEFGTIEMQALQGAFEYFWANHDVKTIAPKKETVKDWIKENYGITSNNMLNAIDSIIRPSQLRTGGQKAR